MEEFLPRRNRWWDNSAPRFRLARKRNTNAKFATKGLPGQALFKHTCTVILERSHFLARSMVAGDISLSYPICAAIEKFIKARPVPMLVQKTVNPWKKIKFCDLANSTLLLSISLVLHRMSRPWKKKSLARWLSVCRTFLLLRYPLGSASISFSWPLSVPRWS